MFNPSGMSDFADLASTVEIKPGDRVAQSAFRGEGVNTVLFAFDTDAGLAEHTAAHPVIIQALEGSILVTADGREVTLEPGGFVHFTARLPHAVRALSPSKMLLFMLTG
ncbi:cupin domain-containing protein [Leucobacter sp. OH1287]|uniref:cupin domain-containing protein n=1 Tax=Leucobacter sp. OH1287 TaxID=2491049 RepID=UPI000F5E166A|nr:cupin domain-containing protein [Leucobacter sp. OH1287]RRD61743.1 cupin domain-containing protein [Leucobacter sp. OH1287]